MTVLCFCAAYVLYGVVVNSTTKRLYHVYYNCALPYMHVSIHYYSGLQQYKEPNVDISLSNLSYNITWLSLCPLEYAITASGESIHNW